MVYDSTHPSLLSRVRDRDDRGAWREFERRYGPLVVGYCRSLGLQLADAEDVRQDVMIRLARALPAFRYDRRRGRFRSWLGQVVRNAIATHFARHARAARPVDAHVLDARPAERFDDGDAIWEDQWMRHHYRLAWQTLQQSADPRHAEVFERLLAGRSIAEIAESFTISAEAVRKIKQRIRDRLREIIASQLRDEYER